MISKVKIRFKKLEVECEEFNCYISPIDGEISCEIDLLIGVDIDLVEQIYSDPFMVVTPTNSYIFSGYKLDEYYEEDGAVKIILRK